MLVSPPGSPEGVMRRPHSVHSIHSPDTFAKSRPQSMVHRPSTSNGRMSTGSRYGAESRTSDDDARTSVKVVVRVRPPLGPSDPGYDLIPQRFQRSMVTVNTNTSLGVESPIGRKIFIFDRVFGEEINQRAIWDYLQDSVDSFLQGYNVSVLAYGQSGAGKSYTMGTSVPAEQTDPSVRGVIPRAASYLFEHLGEATTSNRQSSGLKMPIRHSAASMSAVLQNGIHHSPKRNSSDKSWELYVTYVEIYNEQPRDLLLPETTPQTERPTVMIREDAKGRIYVEGLKSVPVNTIDELLAVLNHGSAIRQTDATAINAKSSRSHAIFTINLRQTKAQAPTAPRDKRFSAPIDTATTGDVTITVESKLHFVDLAGSERMKNTGATGDRAKEGISINAGLASLGKVIAQLSSRSAGSHVSYRDSKLTRILQDSLGGNAITYMIACVTPAEFHLSETLNTVQYAQRARNIQSKPRIQLIADDADKQAVIDRLRTEVAFLRQHIRSAEVGDRKPGVHPDRLDRPNDREVELQNSLLDVQENYATLSQRHAKLIAELTKTSEQNAEAVLENHIPAASAIDRLKRSQANQAQIEQVVLEYEKTIQSLEGNLSTTRSSLANTESSLLERETKLAYIETMNQQLHSRVQKLMDRESNTETYLRDLETRLEGQSTGGERNDAIIADLRKEVARAREAHTNAEDYVTTLEERLVDADHDMELMQRELERLDNLVARQRSLGKLDNLLYELDHIKQNGEPESANTSKLVNGTSIVTSTGNDRSLETLKEAEETELPAETDDELNPQLETEQPTEVPDNDGSLEVLQNSNSTVKANESHLVQDRDSPQPSPAQSRFVAEKFETVSQELFDLRLEHEATVNEFDLLSAKYHQALRTLAEMQDAVDEARHASPDEIGSSSAISRPASYLEDSRINELRNGHLSSTRSLSSELSLAGESATSTDPSDITPISKQQPSLEVASQEIQRLQSLLAEHEQGLSMVKSQYSELQSEHKDTLITVEALRAEVQRNRPSSPSLPPGMLRRMSSQVVAVDRGQRSITSLRAIMSEEYESRPDRMESVELHLSAANHELQSRFERIQSLEAEAKNHKKEIEKKSTIIAGLTRERDRSTMKAASPVDLSMVAQMRDQLVQKETELKSLHDAYATRERQHQKEIDELTAAKTKHEASASARQQTGADHDEKLKELQDQLDEVTKKHQAAKESAATSDKQLTTVSAELAAALASIETLKTVQQASGNENSVSERAISPDPKEKELVAGLQNEVEQQRLANTQHSEKIAELQKQHSAARDLVAQHAKTIETQTGELATHRSNLEKLEKEKAELKSTIKFHKYGLKSLQESHSIALEEMKLSHAGVMAGLDDQITELSQNHEKLTVGLKADLEKAKNALGDLVASAQMALGHPTSADMLSNHVQDVVEEKRHVAEANARLVRTNADLERQLTGRQSLEEIEEQLKSATAKISNHQETIRILANENADHEESLREKEKVIQKHKATIDVLTIEKQKKMEMIEDLEQQLHTSYDQQTNRVSLIHASNSQALIEAQQRIALLEKDLEVRKSLIEADAASRSNTMKSPVRPHSPLTDGQPRSNSMTSNLRKSASIASLPSPPPAIPLPPLPSLSNLSISTPNTATHPSPPGSRHASKEVATSGILVSPLSPTFSMNASRQSMILEEQEARLRQLEEQEARIRQTEKHLHAEKQLTATLEEALVDLETQSNKLRVDAEAWKQKAWQAEEELQGLRKERRAGERLSVQAVEDERLKRHEAERAREVLEERMRALNTAKKRKKAGGLNCF